MNGRVARLALLCALAVMGSTATTAVAAPSTTVVVSQVYGGGGNSGATYTQDFIELFNRGSTAISLNGWSVQYASSAGTTWQRTNLTNVTLQPGQYYLVSEAQGTGGTTPLPTPDAGGTIPMSATAGKVALVSNQVTLSGSCPTAGVVDFVGFGTAANCFEGGAPTATLSNTTAALRDEAAAPRPTRTTPTSPSRPRRLATPAPLATSATRRPQPRPRRPRSSRRARARC
ncbi:MAG TPA: lamin tail domain-containing protein [Solirubrobacter sp.]|nr:lamin tail domain-containing protein [Solirubrobacter sp.]